MKEILILVWEKKLNPRKAVDKLLARFQLIKLSRKERKEVLKVLEWVNKNIITPGEAEEDLCIIFHQA